MAFVLLLWTSAIFAAFIVSTVAIDLDLKYIPASGRVVCESDKTPTLSVYWDRVAQNVAADAKKGPTISAGLYGVMHSAIFDAWKATPMRRHPQSFRHDPFRGPSFRSRYRDDDYDYNYSQCTLRKMAMSHAAYYSIVAVIPDGKKAAARAFSQIIGGCRQSYYFSVADRIGLRSARKIFAIYQRNVLPDNQPQFEHSSDIERWTAERVPMDSPTGKLQKYLTSGWGNRFTFGIRDGSSVTVKDPEPVLLVPGTLDVDSATVSLSSGEILPVTPDLIGPVINPEFVAQADRVVKASAALTDKTKFIAEFWEQGGETSFPPGAWLTIAQYVSFRDGNTEDEDVGMFYAMANAVNDAGVSTWYIKLFYNYARPVRVIRDLAKLGLLEFQRWYNIRKRKHDTDLTKFTTYQMADGDPSPPFPEYTSGHSTFSSSAAEVLKLWTGSDYFGGSVYVKPKESKFQKGFNPSRRVTLRWRTFTEAANEAGKSRIYGGIHFDDGNTEGLTAGRTIGRAAFRKAISLWRSQILKNKRYPSRYRPYRRPRILRRSPRHKLRRYFRLGY